MDNPRHPDNTVPTDRPETAAEQCDRLAWEAEMIAEALASAEAGLLVDAAAYATFGNLAHMACPW